MIALNCVNTVFVNPNHVSSIVFEKREIKDGCDYVIIRMSNGKEYMESYDKKGVAIMRIHALHDLVSDAIKGTENNG